MRATVCALGVLVLHFSSNLGQAQSRPLPAPGTGTSGLAGTIRDTLRQPVMLATIAIEAIGQSAVSDDSGYFRLAGLSGGTHSVTVKRIGYSPLAFEVTLPVDSTVLIEVHLRSVQTLFPVVVRGARSARFAKTGYYERQSLGIGSFISPERVDSLSYLQHPAMFLRDVRGLDVRCGAGGCEVHTRRPPDCLWLFIDGAFTRDQIDQALTTSAVYAIEVYERPNLVPAEFQGPLPTRTAGRGLLSAAAGCGAIAVWTRARGG